MFVDAADAICRLFCWGVSVRLLALTTSVTFTRPAGLPLLVFEVIIYIPTAVCVILNVYRIALTFDGTYISALLFAAIVTTYDISVGGLI